jgi:hypothetical protein
MVFNEFSDGPSEVPLADRNDPIETFAFDRSDEPRGVGIAVRRTFRDQHDANARPSEPPPYIAAPLPIPITD